MPQPANQPAPYALLILSEICKRSDARAPSWMRAQTLVAVIYVACVGHVRLPGKYVTTTRRQAQRVAVRDTVRCPSVLYVLDGGRCRFPRVRTQMRLCPERRMALLCGSNSGLATLYKFMVIFLSLRGVCVQHLCSVGRISVCVCAYINTHVRYRKRTHANTHTHTEICAYNMEITKKVTKRKKMYSAKLHALTQNTHRYGIVFVSIQICRYGVPCAA